MNSYDYGSCRQPPAPDGASLPVPASESHMTASRPSWWGKRRRVPNPPPREPHRPSDAPFGTAPDTAPAAPASARDKNRTVRMAVLCVLLAAGAAAVLVPALRSVSGNGENQSPGDALGGVILGGGLPSVGDASDGTDTSDTQPGAGETDPRPSETDGLTDAVGQDTDYAGGAPEGDRTDEPSDSTAEGERDTYLESTAESAPDTDDGVGDESRSESASEGETADGPESAAEPAESQSSETMPDGAFAIVRQDLSEPDRSVGYIQNTAGRLPSSIPAEGSWLFHTATAPTVLIVSSHPYEGYHDGTAWYDPATGSLAQTDTPGDGDGVVALGAALARCLREAGVTVIHLRVPVAEGESAAATYARTQETVRYYCELYPDIGLVLDLRRSAELSENGEILATAGEYEGEACAQVRISVSGDRATAAVSRDIAAAVELRRALWAEEPTISRPVWVKNGEGLVGEFDGVAMLTLELGSAGNSFAEAERLIAPLGAAITALVLPDF